MCFQLCPGGGSKYMKNKLLQLELINYLIGRLKTLNRIYSVSWLRSFLVSDPSFMVRFDPCMVNSFNTIFINCILQHFPCWCFWCVWFGMGWEIPFPCKAELGFHPN